MKNFRRSLYESLRHWPSILVATLCSLGVAALWGGNIGALWPVIELTLAGDSAQNRIQSEIVNVESSLSDLQSKLDVNGNLEVGDADDRSTVSEIGRLQSKLAMLRKSYDLASRFLPDDPFQTICLIMLALVGTTVLRHVLLICSEMLVVRVSTRITQQLQTRIFAKAVGFDRITFQDYGTSGILSNITYASEMLSRALTLCLGAALREPLRILSCLIGACFVSWQLLLISLSLTPCFVVAVSVVNGRIRKLGQAILAKQSGFHEVLIDALENVATVQAFGQERSEKSRFHEVTQGLRRFALTSTLYAGLSKPFIELSGVAMIAITICCGSYLVVNQETHLFFIKVSDEPLTVPKLLVFFGLLVGASDPLRKLSGLTSTVYLGACAADGIYQLLDRPALVTDPSSPLPVQHPHQLIEFRKVSFHYHPEQKLLDQLDLRIPFGKVVAVVGENGAGKSTLLHLLSRHLDPTDGSIAIDGVDSRLLSIEDLRGRIALVSQATELFNRSIQENLLYGRPDASEQEMVQATKLVQADEFIRAQPDGYHTIVGSGGNRLSGGQRQRLSLARALLRRPEILVLDESTSQIDMESEIAIRDALEKLKGQMTILIVTHRHALLSICDDVYELANGKLVANKTDSGDPNSTSCKAA